MDNTEDKKPLTGDQILKTIGYDNDGITSTERWIAVEVYNHASQQTEQLQRVIKQEEIKLNAVLQREKENNRVSMEYTKSLESEKEALQAKNEADKIYIDTLHGQIGDLKSEKEALQAEIEHYKKLWKQDNEALKSEVERLKEEIKYKVFDYKHAKGQLEKISADYESEAKTDKARITQLEEALRECIMYCHDDTAIERFKKALSQNNQLEKI
jgi:chromosome segregation ATPase